MEFRVVSKNLGKSDWFKCDTLTISFFKIQQERLNILCGDDWYLEFRG